MTSSAPRLALFVLMVTLVATLVVSFGALYYLRRVRLERPAIGTFNGRDIAILFVFLGTIPIFYVSLPRGLLTGFLTLTFLAALSIGYRPLVSSTWLWLAIGVLIGGNIWVGRNMLGTVAGWQLYWVENSVLVVLAAIAVSNLYVQGGMKLKHAAWFALILAGYDMFFTAVFPVTNELLEEFLGFPLDPSVGMRWGFDNASIGLGDLLVYALYLLTAYKAYGRKAARIAFTVVVVGGSVLPALIPLLVNYVDPRTDTVVPAQTWFGPPAFLAYLWMRRHYGRERTTKEFLASDDVVRPRATDEAPTTPVAVPAQGSPEPVPLEGAVSRSLAGRHG